MAKDNGPILVLGVGNVLLSDEAVGVRLAEAVGAAPEAAALGLKALDGGTMGLSLLVEMEDAAALIIVDAARLGAAAGTVRVFLGAEMDDFLRHRGRSPHDIGLDDLMDGLRLRGAVPARRALIGIEPASLSVGRSLSPQVEAAVPIAVGCVLDLARTW
jgi:hydrogenase maturation protease